MRLINDFNQYIFFCHLRSINLIGLYSFNNLNDMVNYFLNTLLDAVDKCFPSQYYTYKPMNTVINKWYTDELRNLKHECLYYDIYIMI